MPQSPAPPRPRGRPRAGPCRGARLWPESAPSARTAPCLCAHPLLGRYTHSWAASGGLCQAAGLVCQSGGRTGGPRVRPGPAGCGLAQLGKPAPGRAGAGQTALLEWLFWGHRAGGVLLSPWAPRRLGKQEGGQWVAVPVTGAQWARPRAPWSLWWQRTLPRSLTGSEWPSSSPLGRRGLRGLWPWASRRQQMLSGGTRCVNGTPASLLLVGHCSQSLAQGKFRLAVTWL